MEKLNTLETSELKEKRSVWYNIFHWAIMIYFFAATIALCYGIYLLFDYLVTLIKSWM